MSFVRFVMDAVKLIVVGFIALAAGIGTMNSLMFGKTLTAAILGVIAFISGLYVIYMVNTNSQKRTTDYRY